MCYLLTNEQSVAEEITSQIFNEIYDKGHFRESDQHILYQHVVANLQNSLLVKRKGSRRQGVNREHFLINEAFLFLPIRERMILGLTHICSLPIEVISSLLDVPKQEVKESLYNSREFLTDLLHKKGIREQLPLLS
ncbi:hypothetical protein [Gracilibacillus xinjiangensis]|uniref:Uncharacterized protein n=1 Tax=Gracilibacillus xinjiangensis TaxID=1193282 RepID=A0ABV8WU26_9BACI